MSTVEAPAEPVTAEVSLNGTVATYQSLLEVEAEKGELYQLRPRLMKKPDGTKEGGLDLFRNNEEARRADRERLRAELEKKRKKEEEEARKKEQEKKMEEERKLAKEIEEGFKSVSKAIRVAKKSVVKKPSKPCQSVVKKMALQSDPQSESIEKAIETEPSIAARAVPVTAESVLTGTEAPYQTRAEMMCVDLEKSRAELNVELSDLLRRRAEICELLRAEIEKKREMEEERIKRAEKQVEKSERLMKVMRGEILIKNARKEAIVASVVS